jgi:hypothetical protein
MVVLSEWFEDHDPTIGDKEPIAAMGTLLEHLDICLKLKFEHQFFDHTVACFLK